MADFALDLGVARSTIYEWAKEHKEFSDILEDILSTQERMLLVNGLNGEYNSTIAKLVLSKHGYRESQDITSDNKAVAPLLVRFLKDDDKPTE